MLLVVIRTVVGTSSNIPIKFDIVSLIINLLKSSSIKLLQPLKIANILVTFPVSNLPTSKLTICYRQNCWNNIYKVLKT